MMTRQLKNTISQNKINLRIQKKEKNNFMDELIISVNTKTYPLEAILGASYVFINKAYIFLDGDPEKKIDIKLTLKPESLNYFQNIKELKKEFLNELLNFSWRHQISKDNKQLREYIVGAALLGATGGTNIYQRTGSSIAEDAVKVIDDKAKTITEAIADNKIEDSFDDPLGIAVPWEEKFQKRGLKKTEPLHNNTHKTATDFIDPLDIAVAWEEKTLVSTSKESNQDNAIKNSKNKKHGKPKRTN